MIKYRSMYTRFDRHWDKMRSFFEKGLIVKPENYDQMRWSNIESKIRKAEKIQNLEDPSYVELLSKFYKRYPDARYAIAKGTPGTVGEGPKNPAVLFLEKQMKLMDEGYSENKAFEMVESEMVFLFDRQREENRILRGFALNNRARSYLNYSQQLAEVEGRAKVQQMERDLNKYITQENRWSDIMTGTQESSQKKLIENSESMLNDKFKELDYSKDSIEQFFTMYTPTSKAHPKNDPKSYEPALYQIINHPKDLKDSESLIDIQRGFINRSEKLLAMHRERSTINDGLKGLNDKEIIQKIREVPTKIKRNTKSLLKKLEKFNLKLDNEGNVDYSGIPYPQLVKSLKKMDTLVKIALMEKDLQFEYPQHLEKAKIKGDILMIANAEESKLNKMEHEREIREMQMNELNYEQYFG